MPPGRFLDDERVDWVASVNLLSQLPDLAVPWLGRGRPSWDARAQEEFGRMLMADHLAYLARFRAPVCLIADLEQVTEGPDGRVVRRLDPLPPSGDWRELAEWRWDIAPPGELGGGLTKFHRVAAFSRTAAARTPGRYSADPASD